MSKAWKRAIAEAPFILAPGLRYIEIEGFRGGSPGIVFRALSDEECNSIASPSHFWPRKLLSFSDWLAAEFLLWRRAPGEKMQSFTRERLIKRVANALGASHAVAPSSAHAKPDDEFLRWLTSSFSTFNRPFPYFLLMIAAYEILEVLGYVPVLEEPRYDAKS